ncbi:MAG TPA: hypothetical protein VJI12_00640 [archaeon]|nr:hypothetical protein [archaeon]
MSVISFIDPATLPFVSTFLFVFAVVFGLLTYSKVGGFDKRVSGAIAAAIGLFSMAYEPLVTSLTQYMPIAVGLLVILFFVAFIQKVLGGGENKDYFPLIIALGISLVLLGMFSDRLVGYLPYGIDVNMVLWGVGIVAVLLFFWFIYKTKNE